MKTVLFTLAFSLLSLNTAFASGAVLYTCAGFEPNTSGPDLSKQAVVFELISAQGATTVQILSKSRDQVEASTALLDLEAKNCKFDMIPDERYPAYRVEISGKCGTSKTQNLKGTCFFQ